MRHFKRRVHFCLCDSLKKTTLNDPVNHRNRQSDQFGGLQEEVSLCFGCIKRIAFAMHPEILRLVIPKRAIGSYLLLRGKTPIYVGRSDFCLLTRLCNHEFSHESTHVVWQLAKTKEMAFCLEAGWYHQNYQEKFLLNKIHPAKPHGYIKACPFCMQYEEAGLLHALPHI